MKIKWTRPASMILAMAVMASSAALPVSAADVNKHETVYVITDTAGTVEETIVSDWLENLTGKDVLRDSSDLSDLEVVKGDAVLSGSGESISWKSGGDDVYYQGSANKKLPVSVAFSYEFDGKAISPEQLKGKSGKLTITIRYRNEQKQTVTVNGKQETMYVPFMMATGMIISSEKASNITVDHGMIQNDGDRVIILGYGLPGLSESLKLQELTEQLQDDGETEIQTLEIPETVTITADVTDFDVDMAMTVATCGVFDDLDLDSADTREALEDAMQELDDAAQALVDGTQELLDGTEELLDGTEDLGEGAEELRDGAAELRDGAKELHDGAETLASGASTLASGASQLDTGAASLDSGAVTLGNNLGTLVVGLQNALEGSVTLRQGLGELKSGSEALQSGMVQLQAGAHSLRDGSKALEAGAGTLTDGMAQLQAGAQTLSSGTSALLTGAQSLSDNAPALVSGANSLSSGLGEIRAGASSLAQSTSTLADGADQLSYGISSAKTGADDLAEGISSAAEGARALEQGISAAVLAMNEGSTAGAAGIGDAMDGAYAIGASAAAAATAAEAQVEADSAAQIAADTANAALASAQNALSAVSLP